MVTRRSASKLTIDFPGLSRDTKRRDCFPLRHFWLQLGDCPCSASFEEVRADGPRSLSASPTRPYTRT